MWLWWKICSKTYKFEPYPSRNNKTVNKVGMLASTLYLKVKLTQGLWRLGWIWMKTTWMRISKGCLFRSCSSSSKGIGRHHLGLADTQRQAGEWRCSIGKKGKAPRVPCLEGVNPREAAGGLAGSKHPMWLVPCAYLAFSDWSQQLA